MRFVAPVLLIVSVSAWTSSAAAAPACPTYEALPPRSDRPTLARLAVKGDCTAPTQLSARVTRSSGEALGVAVVVADRDGVFVVDLGRWLPAGERSGLYRVEWQTSGTPPATVLQHPHTISCPAPPKPVARFAAADATLTVDLPPGDRCQGETVATLQLGDAGGRQIVKPLTQRVPSAAGGRVVFDLRRIEPRARRSASLVLSNATGETAKTPLQLGEVCPREFRVTGQIDGAQIKGRIAADDCHFPVRVIVSLTTERGVQLSGEPATLHSPSFVLEVPRSPRGTESARVIAAFQSASNAQSTLNLAGGGQCPPPTLSDATLERGADSGEAFLTASYSSTLACHASSKLTLQLRDPQNNVIFNRSLEAAPSPNPVSLRWPVKLQPGVPYELHASIAYGVDRAQTSSGRRRLTAGCPAPQILDLGFAHADAATLGAHLRLAPCQLPVTAKLMIRDSGGRAVGAFERVVREIGDAPHYPLGLGSVANLASGRYAATLTLTDARGQAATREATLQRDVDAPSLSLSPPPAGSAAGAPVTISDLGQLTVEATDASGLLPVVSQLAEAPPLMVDAAPRVRIRQANAGAAPDLRLVLEYDIEAAASPSHPVGVLLTDADGRLWRVPAARRYLVFDPEFRPASATHRDVAGVVALARGASLDPGTYRIAGVIVDRAGSHVLVPASHDLEISPLARRRSLATLRQGAKEIPLRVAFEPTGRATLSATAPVPEGAYSLQLEVYDAQGNTTGPLVHQLRVARNVTPPSAPDPTADSADTPALDASQPVARPVAAASSPAATVQPSLVIVGSELVLPKPIFVDLEWRTPPGDPRPADARDTPLRAVLVPRAPLVGPPVLVQAASSAAGRIRVTAPPVPPGAYDLRLTPQSEPTASSQRAYSLPIVVEDGRPLNASVLALRTRGVAPLTGRLTLQFSTPASRGDVASVQWERSTDGSQYEAIEGDPSGVDVALETPGTRLYRARLVNAHTGVESVTDPVRLTAVADERLEIIGPDRTFRGFPIELTASGVPPERVRWRVRAPGSTVAEEHTGGTLTIEAEATGVFYVEAVALDASGSTHSPAAPRVFRAVEVQWPDLQPSVITGPAQVEPGRATTFSVVHPPIFRGRGNAAVQRRGEWELPDGKRVSDQEFVEVALDASKAGPDGALLQYHSWIDGARDQTLTTAVHRVRLREYRWPKWTLDAQTISARVPSIYRLAVRPATWQGWLDIPDAGLKTTWALPPGVRLVHRSDRELIVEVTRSDPFDVSATVIDDRGHSAELSATDVSPFRRTQLAIETVVTPNRTLHTAPLKVKVAAKPVLLPPGRHIERVAYYLNGAQVGATDGAPWSMELTTAGRYHIRSIASIGTEIVAESSTVFEVAENSPADCRIEFLGDFALNGVAKATCIDPDGHIVDYRWYRNGELFDTSGPRVKLTASQLQGLSELSLVATDNAGKEASARIEPPAREGPS